MPLRINFNYESHTAQRSLANSQGAFHKAVEQLSSGLRINRAADDAAGLAISEKLKNQVRGLNQAQRNAQDDISLVQTAEGALNETHDILSRMRELAVQGANDTLTITDRSQIQLEVDQLVSEVGRIATSTQFNTKTLLSGSATNLQFFIGANSGQAISLTISSANATALAINILATGGGNEMTTQAGSAAAITTLDNAIQTVSAQRAKLGAYQNRLEHTVTSLGVASENQGAANDRIRNADVASASAELVRTQILQQAATAILAQANQSPQLALQLLR